MIIMFADMCGCTLIICDTTITDMFNACLSGCLPKCQELGLVGSKSVDNALFFGDFISHGFLRRSLLDSFGNQPDRHGNNDLWIAANALSLNTILVTNNTKEFIKVPDLLVENWVDSV